MESKFYTVIFNNLAELEEFLTLQGYFCTTTPILDGLVTIHIADRNGELIGAMWPCWDGGKQDFVPYVRIKKEMTDGKN